MGWFDWVRGIIAPKPTPIPKQFRPPDAITSGKPREEPKTPKVILPTTPIHETVEVAETEISYRQPKQYVPTKTDEEVTETTMDIPVRISGGVGGTVYAPSEFEGKVSEIQVTGKGGEVTTKQLVFVPDINLKAGIRTTAKLTTSSIATRTSGIEIPAISVTATVPSRALKKGETVIDPTKISVPETYEKSIVKTQAKVLGTLGLMPELKPSYKVFQTDIGTTSTMGKLVEREKVFFDEFKTTEIVPESLVAEQFETSQALKGFVTTPIGMVTGLALLPVTIPKLILHPVESYKKVKGFATTYPSYFGGRIVGTLATGLAIKSFLSEQYGTPQTLTYLKGKGAISMETGIVGIKGKGATLGVVHGTKWWGLKDIDIKTMSETTPIYYVGKVGSDVGKYVYESSLVGVKTTGGIWGGEHIFTESVVLGGGVSKGGVGINIAFLSTGELKKVYSSTIFTGKKVTYLGEEYDIGGKMFQDIRLTGEGRTISGIGTKKLGLGFTDYDIKITTPSLSMTGGQRINLVTIPKGGTVGSGLDISSQFGDIGALTTTFGEIGKLSGTYSGFGGAVSVFEMPKKQKFEEEYEFYISPPDFKAPTLSITGVKTDYKTAFKTDYKTTTKTTTKVSTKMGMKLDTSLMLGTKTDITTGVKTALKMGTIQATQFKQEAVTEFKTELGTKMDITFDVPLTTTPYVPLGRYDADFKAPKIRFGKKAKARKGRKDYRLGVAPYSDILSIFKTQTRGKGLMFTHPSPKIAIAEWKRTGGFEVRTVELIGMETKRKGKGKKKKKVKKKFGLNLNYKFI